MIRRSFRFVAWARFWGLSELASVLREEGLRGGLAIFAATWRLL